MSFINFVKELVSGIACLTIVNDVIVLRWHSWNAHWLNLPTGLGWGILETILFSAIGTYCLITAIKTAFIDFKKRTELNKNG